MVEIDGGLIGEYGFSCDFANARGLLNCRFPYLESLLFSRRLSKRRAHGQTVSPKQFRGRNKQIGVRKN